VETTGWKETLRQIEIFQPMDIKTFERKLHQPWFDERLVLFLNLKKCSPKILWRWVLLFLMIGNYNNSWIKTAIS
jgi:hypothetical protein